jgi:hypothetical protein
LLLCCCAFFERRSASLHTVLEACRLALRQHQQSALLLVRSGSEREQQYHHGPQTLDRKIWIKLRYDVRKACS